MYSQMMAVFTKKNYSKFIFAPINMGGIRSKNFNYDFVYH